MNLLVKILILLAFSSSLLAEIIPDYKRTDWDHWIDNDGNCRDTRHELLIRESLVSVSFKSRSDRKKCEVESGQWYGPYIGRMFTASGSMDLDHIIPIKWAHLHGGWQWTLDQKRAFANDYQNLVLVDSGNNRSKNAKGPSKWLPPNEAYYCEYISKWEYLINKYELKPGTKDQKKINKIVKSCKLN